MNRMTLSLSLFFILIMNSCLENITCIDGNGQVITQSREASEINELVNTTAVDVIYIKADSVSITVTAESNFMKHIETSSSQGRLNIRTDPRNTCFNYTVKPLITVTSPSLNSLELTGSGSMQADSISGPEAEIRSTGSGDLHIGNVISDDMFITVTGSGDVEMSSVNCIEADLTLTGSGNLDISGRADKSVMRVTGSGDAKAVDLIITSATETITGSGNIYTTVVNSLTAVISGSGNIYLRGNPSIHESISGSGRIIKY